MTKKELKEFLIIEANIYAKREYSGMSNEMLYAIRKELVDYSKYIVDKLKENDINTSESNCNIKTVIWLCSKDLYKDNTNVRIFTKGKEYKQIDPRIKAAVDDENTSRIFSNLEKYFIAK